MSEIEQAIIEKVSEAIPEMTEFDKGYLLGKVEEMAAAKERQQRQQKEAEPVREQPAAG